MFLSKKNTSLLKEMVRTDFKLRYQGSLLGYVWSLLKPLMLFGILYVVFTQFLRFGDGVPNFELSLLLSIVLWTFFTEATSQSVGAIVSRGDLLRKIKIPAYIIVLSANVAAFINLGLNMIVVFAFAYIGPVEITWRALWLIPIIVELFLFAQIVSFIISSLYVKFRDMSYIWEVALQMLFYLSPILYPISEVVKQSKTAAEIMVLNPLAQIVLDARYALVYDQTTQTYDIAYRGLWYLPFVIIFALAIFAFKYFRSSEPYFAEYV